MEGNYHNREYLSSPSAASLSNVKATSVSSIAKPNSKSSATDIITSDQIGQAARLASISPSRLHLHYQQHQQQHQQSQQHWPEYQAKRHHLTQDQQHHRLALAYNNSYGQSASSNITISSNNNNNTNGCHLSIKSPQAKQLILQQHPSHSQSQSANLNLSQISHHQNRDQTYTGPNVRLQVQHQQQTSSNSSHSLSQQANNLTLLRPNQHFLQQRERLYVAQAQLQADDFQRQQRQLLPNLANKWNLQTNQNCSSQFQNQQQQMPNQKQLPSSPRLSHKPEVSGLQHQGICVKSQGPVLTHSASVQVSGSGSRGQSDCANEDEYAELLRQTQLSQQFAGGVKVPQTSSKQNFAQPSRPTTTTATSGSQIADKQILEGQEQQQQQQQTSGTKMHVNFNRPRVGNGRESEDAIEGEQRKKKYLTAKYGQQQMNLIKKRLKIEMWLYEQLKQLAQGSRSEAELDEIDIDLDQILDMSDDATRRRWLKKTLEPFEDVPKEKIESFIEQVLEQSRLL